MQRAKRLPRFETISGQRKPAGRMAPEHMLAIARQWHVALNRPAQSPPTP